MDDLIFLDELANGNFEVREDGKGWRIYFNHLGVERSLITQRNRRIGGLVWRFSMNGKIFSSSTTQIQEPEPQVLREKLQSWARRKIIELGLQGCVGTDVSSFSARIRAESRSLARLLELAAYYKALEWLRAEKQKLKEIIDAGKKQEAEKPQQDWQDNEDNDGVDWEAVKKLSWEEVNKRLLGGG